LTINGGAAVALLAFLANLDCTPRGAAGVTTSLWWFGSGLVAGGCATVAAYGTQLTYFNERVGATSNPRQHVGWLRAAATLLLLSLVAFGGGVVVAGHALST
jgi:hypothetical protein